MRAGEIGVTIQATTGTVNITGATATLHVKSPAGVISIFNATVAADGLSASYVTQSGDFPDAGLYIVQLVVVFPSGETLKSAETPLTVEESL